MTRGTNDGQEEVSYVDEDHDVCLGVEDGSFWFRHRNECIAGLVTRYPFKGTFYDVGGGNGYVARRLLDDELDVVLVEPGLRGAENARLKRGIPKVVCGTLSSAGIPVGSAGAVGIFDVVEHVADDRGFIREIATVLQPGGMLYLTVPAYGWMWSNADVVAGHHRRYTRASIYEAVAPFFDVKFVSYYFAPLLLPIALMRALPHRLGVRGSAPTEVEHGTDGGMVVRVMERLLARELRRLEAGRTVRMGASLIMAARRLHTPPGWKDGKNAIDP